MSAIRLEGDTVRLVNRLKKMSEFDRKRINAALAEGMRFSTLDRFKKQKDPAGKRWEPSARAIVKNGLTLIDKSHLRNSIKSMSSATGFAVGTNNIYAKTHQFGRPIRRSILKAASSGSIFKTNGRPKLKTAGKKIAVKMSIPARPYLGFSEDDQVEIRKTIEDAIMED